MEFDARDKARSSGGERYLDTVEVGGSKPPVPTMKIKRLANFGYLFFLWIVHS
jgi:hypothetical protein